MGRAKAQSFAVGAKYTGLKAIFDGEEVGFVRAFYAIEEVPADARNEQGQKMVGHQLLLRQGKPVRLTQVDLAPDDPDDGAEEYLIAGEKDPPQNSRAKGRTVTLEPEAAHKSGKAGA